MERSAGFREFQGASVFIIGSIIGSTGFKAGTLCKWKVVAGRDWVLGAGAISGNTQCGIPGGIEGVDLAVWEHPVDIHFKTQTSQGWPKFCFTVFHRSPYVGRDEFQAYGICTLPTTPGEHELACPTWRPNDRGQRRKDEIAGFFTGNLPQLVDETFIHDRDEAFSASIQTVGMGTVHLRLSLLFKDFDKYAPIGGLTRGGFSNALRGSRTVARRRLRETEHEVGTAGDTPCLPGDESTGQEESARTFRAQRRVGGSEKMEQRRQAVADRMIRTATRNRMIGTDSEGVRGSDFDERQPSRTGSRRTGIEAGSFTEADRIIWTATRNKMRGTDSEGEGGASGRRNFDERQLSRTGSGLEAGSLAKGQLLESRKERRTMPIGEAEPTSSRRLLSPQKTDVRDPPAGHAALSDELESGRLREPSFSEAQDTGRLRKPSFSEAPESGRLRKASFSEASGSGQSAREDGNPGASESRSVFARLGRWLAEEGASARALFEAADADGSGALSRTELRRLVQRLLPGVSAKELRYVQLMLDEDGNGRVTFSEFEALVQACASIEQASRQRVRVGSAEADIMRRLRFIASDDPKRVQALFDQYDQDKSGYLDQAELLSMVKELMPPMDARDRRFIVASLAFRLDGDGDGRVRFEELLRVLKQ